MQKWPYLDDMMESSGDAGYLLAKKCWRTAKAQIFLIKDELAPYHFFSLALKTYDQLDLLY